MPVVSIYSQSLLRNRHLHIARDSELLQTIYRRVEEELVIDFKVFFIINVLKFALYFSLVVIFYSLLYVVQNPALFICTYIAFGFFTLLLAFNFSHDCSHNTLFKSKKANNFCFIALYTLVGAHGEAWKQRHVQSHHYAPNVKGYDSDLKISKLIRIIPGSPWLWCHKFQHVYAPIAYTTYSLFWILVKDFYLLYSIDDYNQVKNPSYHLSFWLQKSFYFGAIFVLPMLYGQQAWGIVLLGFLLMHLSQSLFLLLTFFMTHHVEGTLYPVTSEDGTISTSWVMNQIKSSNDMHPFSKTANFILGGFNNHIAHHLFPHIHHTYYPQLSQILYSVLEEHNIQPNQTSYLGGILSHFKLLKRMSKP